MLRLGSGVVSTGTFAPAKAVDVLQAQQFCQCTHPTFTFQVTNLMLLCLEVRPGGREGAVNLREATALVTALSDELDQILGAQIVC